MNKATAAVPAALLSPIETITAARAWIEAMIRADLLFHFDEAPVSIIKLDGSPLFSPREAALIHDRVGELYQFDWTPHECPIGYALDFLDQLGLLPKN